MPRNTGFLAFTFLASTLSMLLAFALPNPASAAQNLATVTVERSDANQQIKVDGRIEAELQAVIGAQTAGRVTERLVEAGDSVRKGQLLLRIDDRESQQLSHVSQAQLSAAEAQLAQAQLDKERNAAMLAKKLIGQAVYDQAETRYRAALADVKALQASSKLSQTQASFTQVLAPFAGVVSDINVNVGDLATAGKPLLTVYNPAQFRVMVSLSTQVLNRWQRAQATLIELNDGSLLSPTATVLLPQTDSLAQQVQVRFDLPARAQNANALPLMPGGFVKVHLPIQTAARLMLPTSAVIRRGELTAVYVMHANTPQLRQVRVGKTYGDQIEIMAGVDEGTIVALYATEAAVQRVQLDTEGAGES